MQGIYIFTHTVSGMAYVGQSRKVLARISQQLRGASDASLLYAEIVTEGISAFRIEIEPYLDVTPDELDAIERQRIQERNSLTPNGFNVLKGKKRSTPRKRKIKRLSNMQWDVAIERYGLDAERISKAYGVSIVGVEQRILRQLKSQGKPSLFQQQRDRNKADAVKLAKERLTLRQIADRLGYKSIRAVTYLLKEQGTSIKELRKTNVFP